MIKKNSKNHEYDNFTELSHEWWKPEGKFKILHQILPIRIEYILNNINRDNIKNLNILDLGCGGGLTCEPLARLGAKVTGIDFIKNNIDVAKKHAMTSNLNITYIKNDLNKIELKDKYDVVLLLEVIEHLDDWQLLIKKIKKILKPKAKLIISTINKTKYSKIFAIDIAENILGWVPKNTHNYQKLVDPKKLKIILIKNQLLFLNITGMNFNPILREWKLNKDFYPINYFCTAQNN
jgi:2-polyprenyl-6-hydroxyphenyl methylase/3-demethylubiquinone-9 3-methyltransferase